MSPAHIAPRACLLESAGSLNQRWGWTNSPLLHRFQCFDGVCQMCLCATGIDVAKRAMLEFESLCLSTQFVISLSVKTLLKHAVSVLFLLNSAWFLSVKTLQWTRKARVRWTRARMPPRLRAESTKRSSILVSESAVYSCCNENERASFY
jgi:hypothetical protein